MASANQLILLPKTQRRGLKTFNLGLILIIIASIGLIIMLLAYSISRLNPKPTEIVNGAPKSTVSTTHASDYGAPETDVSRPSQNSADDSQSAPNLSVVTQATAAPMTRTDSNIGSSIDASHTTAAQVDAIAREEQQHRAEEAARQEQARQERLDASSRSLGAVTIVNNAPASDTATTATNPAVGQTRYAPPKGPILALDSLIPTLLTRSLDSTFGGQFEVVVTDNVMDEQGRTMILPRGSHCYGTTSAGGVDGQSRIYATFNLCKLPDRTRIVLDNFPAIDTDGATGLKARVDDHGANRRTRGSAFMSVPSMLIGTVVPGVASGLASTTVAAAQQSAVGRAIPGPTLYVDASQSKPRVFSILVTKDTSLGAIQ